jgi:sugar phosphate isomerase/epimerase
MSKTLKPWRLSLAHLTVDEADPFELIEAATAAGFDSIGLRVIPAAGAPARTPLAGDDDLTARVKKALALSGLSVLQVNSFWITPQRTAVHFAPVLDAALELGAENVLVVIADPDLARGTDHFDACCAAADAAGIGIALEFHSYSPVRSLAQALRIVEESGYQGAGLVVDTLHFDRTGGQPGDLAGLPEGRLRFVQLADATATRPAPQDLRREARTGRLYPGEGQLPLFAILDALPGAIPLDLEAPSAHVAHLPVQEQARLAGEATRRFLARYAEHASATRRGS